MPKEKGEEWDHVLELESVGEVTNGVKRVCALVKCLHWDRIFSGGAVRIRGHLSGASAGVIICPDDKVPAEIRQKFQKKDLEKKEKKLKTIARQKMDFMTSAKPINVLKQPTLHEMTQKEKTNLIDRSVARLFYGAGLSFNLANTAVFKEACEALHRAPAGYRPPNREKLRNSLLQAEHEHVQKQINEKRKAIDKLGKQC